ncbi:hypothetical protein H4R21_000015 [Coemansia helicoidea]|uniref:Uncharacterized protein n=1 Tax=Coemansia helicoidea TaxID=1286919 RepID=A0ACC1LHR4_9FUNG|nr:hypothetical protein H4R21_000015 [Coemansia helicoidea]
MAWAHRHMERRDAAAAAPDPHGFGSRMAVGALGLDIPTGRRFMGPMLSEDSHSPTVPDHLFTDDSAPLLPGDAAHATGLPTPTKAPGAYTLNPDFIRAQDAKAPPVPHLPEPHAGSFPSYPSSTTPHTTRQITFPRPGDEARRPDGPATPAQPHGVHVRSHASPEPSCRTARVARDAALLPKRNYSLPSALAPQTPKLQLEDYEFTSIESLERKWASVKTESTRMLSSAIYKYYFSHGEWTEFEQVFPGRVLEAWEDFRNKLSLSELAFINTVLVSQNPFSGGQGGQKHIPLLARTIPLAQVVRTMVFAEDMHSRESYSSQGSNGTEVDAQFADWLIARFNAKKPGSTLSPSDTTFEEPSAKAPQQPAPDAPSRGRSLDPKQSQQSVPTKSAPQTPIPRAPAPQTPATQTPAPRAQAPQTPAPRKSVDQVPAKRSMAAPLLAGRASIEMRPAMRERVVHKSVSQTPVRAPQAEKPRPQYEFPRQEPAAQEPAAASNGLRPKSAMTLSGTGAPAPQASEKPATPGGKARRMFSFGSRSELRPATAAEAPRRPSITMPTIFQSFRKGSRADVPPPADVLAAAGGHDINLPPSPPPAQSDRPSTASSSTSRTRRHTHNFFSSRPVEVRSPAEPGPAGRRLTREMQMKDLPPLPPNATEISQLARLLEADVRVKATQSASMLRQQPGVLAHFSSHAELNHRTAGIAQVSDMSQRLADAATISERSQRMADAAAVSGKSQRMADAASISEKGRRTASPAPDRTPRRPSVAASTHGYELAAATPARSCSRESGSTEIARAVFNWRPAPQCGDTSWGFAISPLALREPMERKQSNAVQLVVHSHTPTMNRRDLPAPEGTKSRTTPRRAREARLNAAAKEAKPPADSAEAKPAAANSGKPAEAAVPPQAATTERPATAAPAPAPAMAADAAPALPKAKMPQDKACARPVPASGVRGVLYELAYLSTQGKNVWSKSEHIFAHMAETGLEVNRIAEQDFFDFCVDELLKASNDASHDLQSMGNKVVARKLYQSFNTKLSTLLAGSAL